MRAVLCAVTAAVVALAPNGVDAGAQSKKTKRAAKAGPAATAAGKGATGSAAVMDASSSAAVTTSGNNPVTTTGSGAAVISTATAAPAAGSSATGPATTTDDAYRRQVEDWRVRVERGLRQDNGWLALIGRDVLKPGPNRLGSAIDNDVVYPAHLSPPYLGTLHVSEDGEVRLTLVPGVRMTATDGPGGAQGEFTDRVLKTGVDARDWVSLGRLSLQVVHSPSRDRFVLRSADNENPLRRDFRGRAWYPVDPRYRVGGRFVPYDPPQTVEIVNVLGEVADENMVGYVEFELDGRSLRLDALAEGDQLWFLLRDASAGDTTYPAGRFLAARRAHEGDRVTLDFNRAYNPPCAFSKYTTCPLPPPQNDLPVRIDAGEKYVPLE